MDYLFHFVAAVMASVTSYYICKWLDHGDKKDS